MWRTFYVLCALPSTIPRQTGTIHVLRSIRLHESTNNGRPDLPRTASDSTAARLVTCGRQWRRLGHATRTRSGSCRLVNRSGQHSRERAHAHSHRIGGRGRSRHVAILAATWQTERFNVRVRTYVSLGHVSVTFVACDRCCSYTCRHIYIHAVILI